MTKIPIIIGLIALGFSAYTLWSTRLAPFSLKVVSTGRVVLALYPGSSGALKPAISIQLLFSNNGSKWGYVDDVALVLKREASSAAIVLRSLYENLEDSLNFSLDLPPPKMVTLKSFALKPGDTVAKEIMCVTVDGQPELNYELGKFIVIPYTSQPSKGWVAWKPMEIEITSEDLSVLSKTAMTPNPDGSVFLKWSLQSKPTIQQDRSLQSLRSIVNEPLETIRSSRITAIDLLRGIVMVIMMLDHTRDFVHSGAFSFDPTDLKKTTTTVFLTRWITHFCAPVFVFLAGTSVYLQLARGKSKRDLSKFLVTRGLWLILLELTVIKLGVFFNFDYRFLAFLQVIWVLGVSMIVLAALIHLPLMLTAALGLAMIAFHNLLDPFRVVGWEGPGSPVPGPGAKLWMILHQPWEAFPVLGFPSPVVVVVYPLIPWIGVMLVGFAFGALYKMDAQRRLRWLLLIGGIATVLFIVLRASNIYGDPSKWSSQKNLTFTVLSFLNTTKYPPSLLFLLMTLGPAIAALAWFEPAKQATMSLIRRLRNAFVTFGRVPLFFYVLQWYTAHFIGIFAGLIFGQPVAWQFASPVDRFASPPPQGVGSPLWVVYVCWIIGVLLLYPLCKWFAEVKARRRDWWLSYL